MYIKEILQLVRANIRRLVPYSSARSLYGKGVLMDANENPYNLFGNGMDLNRYPDCNNMELRKKISDNYRLKMTNCAVGNGSDEIIDILFKIFCDPVKDNIIISNPTYGIYKTLADIYNVKIIDVPLVGFQLNTKAILNKISDTTKLIFICSPNNPTGKSCDYKNILEIAGKSKKIVVVDEAYAEFSEEVNVINIKNILRQKNLVIIRTLSKAHALAGVRLGYAIANKHIIDLIQKVKSPYNISSITTQVALKVIDNKTLVNEHVQKIINERTILINKLKKVKKVEQVYPTDANFILFKITDADKIFNKLIDKGIIIRNRSKAAQLKDCLRVTVGTKEQNQLFIKSLKEIVKT